MNDYIYNIDSQIDTLLQRELVFRLNDQTFKRGRLIIYSHGYFTLLFTIKNHKKMKNEVLKVPIPFLSTIEDTTITFDYRIKTLFTGNAELESMLKEVKKPNLSKFYDKLLTIEAI
jgi:hypothetical protein